MAELPQDPQAMAQTMPTTEGENTITISITRDANGNYTVEKETPDENAAETGEEGSPEEMLAGATKARDLKDALNIAKSMFEETDSTSAEALFTQGFGDVAAKTTKKPMM